VTAGSHWFTAASSALSSQPVRGGAVAAGEGLAAADEVPDDTKAKSVAATYDDANVVNKAGDGPVDFESIRKYTVATFAQVLVMTWLTLALDRAFIGSKVPLVYQKTIVGVWFLFNALRSRVFSPLEAKRPKMADEANAIVERKRPSWMPPPLAFPIIWSTIALLRAASAVLIFTTAGTLNSPALLALIVHLAVGDTWNFINNVEKRLGTAVLGVGAVTLSVYNVVFQFYRVLPTAGFLIAPSAVWISVAAFLVYSIWKINPGADGELELLLPRQ